VPKPAPSEGAEAADGLETPLLLIAMPQVLDPFFQKSVVLLLHHDGEGSFGLILNRRTGLPVRDILSGMDIPWEGDAGAVAQFGGPVQPQLGTVLFVDEPAADRKTEAANEVLGGVFLTQHVGDLGRLATAPPSGFRLFLGYAGWGAGQLVSEIQRNDWILAPVQPDLIFADDPDGVWNAALSSMGVDPDSLPAWTPGGAGGAN
jgi:putative transcriptional regulator